MLSDIKILEHMEAGNIVIDEFDAELLNTNSYDVCLGQWYSRQNSESIRRKRQVWYNTSDGQNIMWRPPVKANEVITVYPGETILCHTQEIIGGRNVVSTEMRAKSTTGRYGLSVCKCAGLGDVGFVSRWTMEMTNHSDFEIVIPIGERIAQIIFHEIGNVNKQYGDRGGRYGQGEWSPVDMLPKMR